MKTTKYGLRFKKTGKIVGYDIRYLGDDVDGCNTPHELGENYKKQWLVDSPEHAEYVRLHSTEWYNANYETPEHNFVPDALEVVKIVIETTITKEEVKISMDTRDLFELLYAEEQPEHLQHIKDGLDKGMDYSPPYWSQVSDALRKRIK